MNRRTINIGGEQVEVPDFKGRTLLYIGLGVVVILLLFSSVYTVDADEVGVVQQFGKYVRETQPGLHFKLPWGIEKVTKVKVQRVFKHEFGFRTAQAGIKTQYSNRSYETEALMLTGDLNIAVVEWIVQYRIMNPEAYLFKVRNVESTIRDASEAVMRQVVGDMSVDEVIILSRKDIANRVEKLLQELVDEYQTGVHIVTVNLQDVNPPEPVQPAFNSVNEARQDKERFINEAWEQYNKEIPRAEGKAEQTVLQAEGYATERINNAKGDADKFIEIYREYRLAKDVTRKRLYLETMKEIFPRIEGKVIIDEDMENLLPLLNLNGKGVQ